MPFLPVSALLELKQILNVRKDRKQRGLTFLEILVVVIIMGFLAAASIPKLGKSYQHLRLQQKTDHLIQLMLYAQSHSVMQGRRTRLSIDQNQNRYWLEVERPQEDVAEVVAAGEARYERLSGRWGQTFSIPEDISVELDQNVLTFFPDGQIEKQRFSFCRDTKCLLISTEWERGMVRSFPYDQDDEG